MKKIILEGNYPVLATPFDEDGRIDKSSLRNLIDYLIDKGVHGLVILANGSEGHAMNEEERKTVMEIVLKQVDKRIPIITTVSHFASEVAVEKAKMAEDFGADAVMSMPQLFGQWRSSLADIKNYFQQLSDAVNVPIVVQDHLNVSGIIMPSDFLVKLTKEIENVKYLKLEFQKTPTKITQILALGKQHVDGIFGGTNAVFYIYELAAGSTGVMPDCTLPGVLTQIYESYKSGDKEKATELFEKYLPLISFETYLGDCRSCTKAILKHLGVIKCDYTRGPQQPLWNELVKKQLFEIVDRLDIREF